MDAEDQRRHDHDPAAPSPHVAGRPRRRWLRRLVVVVLVVAAVVVLFAWVFPWVVSMQQDPLLGAQVLRVPR